MGYLNDLLSRNPLVIDGDTIRPHHKYTDDLYTGGIKMAMDKNIKLTINGKSKPTQTNYDRIKSMSVEEMAEMLIEVTEAPLSGEPFWRTPDGKLFSIWEKTKDEAVEHTIQWLLQEASDEK